MDSILEGRIQDVERLGGGGPIYTLYYQFVSIDRAMEEMELGETSKFKTVGCSRIAAALII